MSFSSLPRLPSDSDTSEADERDCVRITPIKRPTPHHHQQQQQVDKEEEDDEDEDEENTRREHGKSQQVTSQSHNSNNRPSTKSDLGGGLSENTVDEEEAADMQSSQKTENRPAVHCAKKVQQKEIQKMSAEQQLHRHPPLEPLLKYTFPALNEALVNVPAALFGGRALMMMACNPQVDE